MRFFVKKQSAIADSLSMAPGDCKNKNQLTDYYQEVPLPNELLTFNNSVEFLFKHCNTVFVKRDKFLTKSWQFCHE